MGTPSPRRIPCAYMYDTPHGQPGWLMREAPSGDARVLGFIAQHGQLTLAQMLRQRPVDGFHELLVTMQDGDTSKPGAVYLHRDDPGRLIHVSPRRGPGPTIVSKPPPPQGARRGLHCYLICLQRSQVRRRYVKDKLLPALPQFECEIVDAVDGRAMLEASTSATSPHGEDSTDAASAPRARKARGPISLHPTATTITFASSKARRVLCSRSTATARPVKSAAHFLTSRCSPPSFARAVLGRWFSRTTRRRWQGSPIALRLPSLLCQAMPTRHSST